jgi:hypothetical protein
MDVFMNQRGIKSQLYSGITEDLTNNNRSRENIQMK